MGWFKSRREEKQASLITAMSTAFATALSGVLSAQAAQMQQNTAFLGTLNDLSAKKASQILGSRGGRKTAERKKKLKMTAQMDGGRGCRLCDNPMARNVQLWEIEEHRRHEAQQEEAGLKALPAPEPEPELGN